MDRKEAIHWIKQICAYLTSGNPVWRNEPIIESCDLAIKALEQSEQKKGKWIEKSYTCADEGSVIDEWQSCKCSICGRYDTRPYLYYFDEPRFCSWCGAKMDERRE